MSTKTKLDRFKIIQIISHPFVVKELSAELKTGHWMWYTFPQIVGLGHSDNAMYYGIKSFDEACQYLADDYLKENLYELCEILLNANKTACEIFGTVDALKLKSCMTLFDYVKPDDIFEKVLVKFYGGDRCQLTLGFLRQNSTQ